MSRRIGRMRAVLLAVLALAMLGSSFGTQAAARKPKITTRTVKEDYVGTFDPLTFGRCKNTRVPVNIGEVCIGLKKGDLKVTLSITDVADPAPGLFYIFTDAGGGCVGDTGDVTSPCPNANSACGSTKALAVPKGAVALEVYATGGPLAFLECGAAGTGNGTGGALVGTVTAKILNKS